MRSQPANVKFTTTATVGIRGTGFALRCEGRRRRGRRRRCRWLFRRHVAGGRYGIIARAAPADEIVMPAGSAARDRRRSQGRAAEHDSRIHARQPQKSGPTINVDLDRLFGSVNRTDARARLYVNLRDGHLAVSVGDRSLDIGRSEALFADARRAARWSRLDAAVVHHQRFDATRPDKIDSRGARLLDMQALGLRARAPLACIAR